MNLMRGDNGIRRHLEESQDPAVIFRHRRGVIAHSAAQIQRSQRSRTDPAEAREQCVLHVLQHLRETIPRQPIVLATLYGRRGAAHFLNSDFSTNPIQPTHHMPMAMPIRAIFCSS